MIQRHDLKLYYVKIYVRRFLNMHEEMCEAHPIMQTVMAEMWELLTQRREKESCSHENGYDNTMDGSKNP